MPEDPDRARRNTGTGEFEAIGRELLGMGARCYDAGKRWLKNRRDDMTNQYDRSTHGAQGTRQLRGQGMHADSRGDRQRDSHEERYGGDAMGAYRGRASGGDREQGWGGEDRAYGQQGGQQGAYRNTDYDDPRDVGARAGYGGWQRGEHGSGDEYADEAGGYAPGYSESSGGVPRGWRGRQEGGTHAGRYSGYETEDPRAYQGRSGAGGMRSGSGEYGAGAYGRAGGGHSEVGHEQDGGRWGSGGSDGEYGDYGQQRSGARGQSGGGPRRMPSGRYGSDAGRGGYGHNGDGQGYAGGYSGGGYSGYGGAQRQSGRSGMGGTDGEGYGGHSGKGPSAYRRSDERITEDLNEILMHDDDIDATHIRVEVKDGEVTLEGMVQERWMKHRAEDLADRCPGVNDVDNRIRVKRSGSDDDESGAASQRGKRQQTSSSGKSSQSAGSASLSSAGGRSGVGSGGSGSD